MTDPLSKAAGHLLSCLPQDGKPVGNIVLRRSSELSEEKFEDAREELIARGLAVPGKGKGGALRRVVGKGRAYYADFPEDSLRTRFPALRRALYRNDWSVPRMKRGNLKTSFGRLSIISNRS